MKMEALFENKGENHLLPFLWVHGEDEATYRKMVNVIHDANIGAFCVEARPHKEFCQAGWWHDMDILLDEAEKLGMKVWILDDKHFPTGFAAGKAMEAPLEQRRQGIFVKKFPVKGKIRLNTEKHCHPTFWKDGFMPTQMQVLTDMMHRNNVPACKFEDDRVLSVTAIRKDIVQEPVDLSPYVHEGVLEWTAPEGEWEVHLCSLSRNLGSNRSYINMMDRDSCRIQLEAVYEPHYEHYKDKFGTVIAGFFSDEPELGNNYMYRMANPLGTAQDLPWSRELETALREKLGAEYASLVPLLWCNDCDEKLTAKVRFTYMDCVSRLVEEDFSKQIGQWCREHGVEYIGHVVEDNNQHARTGTSLGHYFRGLKWQTMAGIDDIGGQVEPGGEDKVSRHPLGHMDDGEFYHYALGKLGSSLGALNPHMQGRTMCEIFGNYGWKEGVKLEKYLVDHFMVRGVNYFVPHAFTASAYPEKDCPPHFYAQGHNPQYRHFGKLMEYTNRVCNLISGGRAVTPVAILYHGEAEWAGKCMLMQKVARVCLDNQIDFAFMPADAFGEREFYRTEIGDTFSINGQKFEKLVLPYAQFITPETAQAIEELGNRVLFVDALPEGLTNGEALPEHIKNCTVVPLSQLKETLSPYKTVRLTPENNRIRAMQYHGDEELIYLFHEGQEVYEGLVELPIKEEVCAYNGWDNRLEELEVEDGRVKVKLYPGHSLLIVPKKGRTTCKPLEMLGSKQELTHFVQSVCSSVEYPNFTKYREIDRLDSYHLTDPKFSGYIRYETEIEGSNFVGLEITENCEGVEVFVNGQSAGIQVIAPYSYDLTSLCSPGKNTLTIEVATTLERERGRRKNAASTGLTGTVILYRK